MQALTIFSADDHIVEPPELFDSMPDRVKPMAPRVVRTDDGDGWVVKPGDNPILVTGGLARKSRVLGNDWWSRTFSFENIDRGAFDPGPRLEDMDLDGVDGHVLYPQMLRNGLRDCVNREVRAVVARAYNHWIVSFDHYSSKRFVGLALLPPLDDGPEVTDILQEARELGLRGAFLVLGRASKPLHHPDFEQFWARAAQLRMPISLHLDSGVLPFDLAMSEEYKRLPGTAEAHRSLAGVALGQHLGHLIFGGVFDRYAGLRIVLAESGVGWIPYLLERWDDLWDHTRGAGRTKNSRPPSEIANEQIFATFQRDRVGVEMRHVWGADNMMWASDYPHMMGTFPESKKVLDDLFGGLPDADTSKLVYGNVAKLYELE